MTADELAERSGTSVEYVRTLIELGIVSADGAELPSPSPTSSVSGLRKSSSSQELPSAADNGGVTTTVTCVTV